VKVIFIADVQNVARAGQTKEVADGYARNFLFPKKLAVLANSQAAAAVESHLKKVVKQRALEEAEMEELAKKIGSVEITLKAKVGENDKLYGSITGADIAEALSKAAGREIDKRKIELAEPIKQVGVFNVTVRFTHDITAVIKVNVMSDEAVEEKLAKAEKKAEKAEAPVGEKKEKAGKKEKKEKKEKPPKEARQAEPAREEKAEKPAKAEIEEKPPKEKKPKAAKAEKEDKPEPEEKKEKKPRAKAKKSEAAVEEKKE
jgi:large subunit ribosomal protein L9